MLYGYEPSNFIGKCGNDCGNCPLFKRNLQSLEDRQRTAEGCAKYIRWNPNPEKLKQCSGCQSEKGFKYLPNCKMRVCAIYNEIKNCAYCSEFPCQDSPKYLDSVYKIEGTIPEEDYKKFIAPWDGTRILEKFRETLPKDQIVNMKSYSVNLKIVSFPKDIELADEELSKYRKVHSLLSSIYPIENVSFARAKDETMIRKYLIKLLWAFGVYGEYREDNQFLFLNCTDYFKEMKKGVSHYGSWDQMKHRFDIFENNGVNVELVPETEDVNFMTDRRNLRRKGWS